MDPAAHAASTAPFAAAAGSADAIAAPAASSPSASSSSSTRFPIWLPPAHYAGADHDVMHISKADLITGKQHRNRLRATQQYLSIEVLEWSKQLLRKNIMAADIFSALANGELLCCLVNLACPPDPPLVVTPGATVKSLEARAHVGAFLRAAARIGVATHNLFKPKDLMKRANDRRVMRTLLYFSLALMKYGVRPPACLHSKVQALCRSTGYNLPEVLQGDGHCLGRFGIGYVRPATAVPAARELAPISPAPADTAAAVASAADRARTQEALTAAERRRREMEANSADFRPQLHFLGTGGRKKRPQPQPPSAAADNPFSANASPVRMQGGRDGLPIGYDPALLALDAEPRMDSPDLHHARSAVANDGLSNANFLAHDASGFPIPSFPHPHSERFEAALQNLDLNDLLQAASDETDIDKPNLASLLFPAFDSAAGGSADPSSKHGAWNRHAADLHVRVDPIKFAMFTSRHPTLSFAAIWTVFFLSLMLLFAPYPKPFRIDLAASSFHARGDPYVEASNMFKAAVQNSWMYVQMPLNNIVLQSHSQTAETSGQRQETLQAMEEERRERLISMARSRHDAAGPSRFSVDPLAGLLSDLRSHHDDVLSLSREADLASSTHDTTALHANSTSSEHLLQGLLHAAADGFDFDARWKARHAEIQRARSMLQSQAPDQEASDDAPRSSASRSLFATYDSTLARRSQLGTTITVLYVHTAGSNLLTLRSLNLMHDYEVGLTQPSPYGFFCLLPASPSTGLQASANTPALNAATGRYAGCEFPDTLQNYFAARVDMANGLVYMDGANATHFQNLTTIKSLMQQWGRRGFFDAGWESAEAQLDPTMLRSAHAITTLSFGTPLPVQVDGKDTRGWSIEYQLAWLQDKILDEYIGRVNGRKLGDGSRGEIALAIDGPGVQLRILQSIIYDHDLLLIVGSVFAVMTYMLLHIRSLFLVLGCMLQTLFAFFVAAFVYRVVFQIAVLNILHILCLFVVLALGTNDAFVLWDTFWHSSLLRLRVELPLDRALRKKRQQEAAFTARQEDRTCRGACRRWWYDDSGCYTAWRWVKRHIPCATVTDLDLAQHFETGIAHSNPLAPRPIGGVAEAIANGRSAPGALSSFVAGGAASPNPLTKNRTSAAAQSPVLRQPGGKPAHGRAASHSDTPTRTRLERDSDEEMHSALYGDSVAGAGPSQRSHHRLGSQEFNPPAPLANEENLDSSDPGRGPRIAPPARGSSRDLRDEHEAALASDDVSAPFSNAQRLPSLNGRNNTVVLHADTSELATASPSSPLPSPGYPLSPTGFGYPARSPTASLSQHGVGATRANGFVAGSSGPEILTPEELERRRNLKVLAAIQNMDGLEEDEDTADLEAMASRNGGLRSAILRKQADRLALRLSWTYRRAAPAMFVTNGTIIVALYAIGISTITPIKHFGVFMGTVALVNFCLSLTMFPTMLVLQYFYLRNCRIVPKACWDCIKSTGSALQSKANAGDEKYDRALDLDPTAANPLEGDLSGGARPLPGDAVGIPTHTHASKSSGALVGTATLSPSQYVNIRSIVRSGDLSDRGDLDAEEPALRHIRGGVNVTKENEETKQEMANATSEDQLGPPVARAAVVAVEAPPPAPARPKEGQLVKKRLDESVVKDAERAKANANLEKSRRNQMLLFLNSVLFRFRFLCIIVWALILVLALSQAVKLTIPRRVITILPPSSNLERLRSAYAQLPACVGCTYEFDRVEHQVVPWASSFPISNVEADANVIDSAAMGGQATISALARTHAAQVLRSNKRESEIARRRLLQVTEFVLPSDQETREATLEMPTHLIEEYARRPLVWKPMNSDATRSSGASFVHAARRHHASRSLALEPSESLANGVSDFLSRSLLVPSAPPLFSIASVGYASVRVVFAQSLFAGLSPIESYTLTLVPVRSLSPTPTAFSATVPTCQTNAGNLVSKVSVTLRPALAQVDLSPVAACTVNATDSASTCSARALSDGGSLGAVTLAADWFSTATVVGGRSYAGITQFASGGLIQDLRGFEHATHYEASIVARSSAGDSARSVVKSFSTLDGTPFAPIIKTVSIALSSAAHVDAAGNQNPQFTLSIDAFLNYQARTPALPLPSKITVVWQADPTFPSAATSGALPVDGSSESHEVDVSSQTAGCSSSLNCTIAMASFQSTQIRGGQRLLVWIYSTNAHNSSVASSPHVLMVPAIRPFAPVLAGFTFLSSATFLSPILRVYFQQPSSNEGPSSVPTHLQLLYNPNVGGDTTSVQRLSVLRPWSDATWAVAAADTPIATLNPVLPVASAPLYQLDFAASDLAVGHPIVANSALQIRLQSRNSVGTSENSNVLVVQSRSAPIAAPTITSLVWASNSLTVSWTPPAASPNDPSPTYSYQIMLSAPSPAYNPRTLTSYPRVSAAVTTSPFTFSGGVTQSEYYYVTIVAITSYGQSELAPAQCIRTISGSHPLSSGTLGICSPERSWNRLCLSKYDGSERSCASKTPLRVPLVDHMIVYAEPPLGSPTRQNLTSVRRFRLTNPGSTASLLLDSVTTLPMQPMQTFASPINSSVKCLDGGYGDFSGAIAASCYAPCFTQNCASLCGALSFSVDEQPAVGRSWASSQYGASTSALAVEIPAAEESTQFVVTVRPDPSLAPGLYSCGFNFNATIVDLNGVVTSSLGTPVSGVASEVSTPFDLVISLRVLPLRKPAPVRAVEYNAISDDSKNISFVVPYSPPDQPICFFQLRTRDVGTAIADSRTFYLDAPTAADGQSISALLPGVSTEQIFSVRAFSALGALDFESETWTADCSSTDQIPANPYGDPAVTVNGLQQCSGIGSCRTPLHMFRLQSVGVASLGSDTAPAIYPILSSSFTFDVMNTDPQPRAGVFLCRCPTGKFSLRCSHSCPSSVPRLIGINGLPIAISNAVIASCSGRGECAPSTHKCSCHSGYGGDSCDAACPRLCNSRGTCAMDPLFSLEVPRCFCRDGWGGLSCADVCPNRCSGHGVCNLQTVCECETQWRGPSCAKRCPGSYLTSTGTARVCNGRGVCSATADEDPICVCNDPSDTSSDCSMQVGRLSSVHYSMPATPDLPAFMLPTIHVTWGVAGVSHANSGGGVSSAADTGSDRGTFVSVSDSISAGTPHYSPSFDLTNTDAQTFLRAVCDVIFGSGLIHESASSCIMTALESYNSVPSNPGATGSFPIASSSFTRTLIYFLTGLSGERQVWRQHVGFLFSTNPFPAIATAGGPGIMPSVRHRTTFEQQAREASDFQASSEAHKEGWANSFLRRFRSGRTEEEEDAASSSAPVYLNYFQLDYLLRHPAHGSEFVMRFHGESQDAAQTMSSSSSSSAAHGARNLAGTLSFHVHLCSLSMQFVGTFDEASTSAGQQLQFADAWTDLLSSHINPAAPAAAGGAFHTSEVWPKMSQQLAFRKGVTGGFVLMFVFIFLFVLLSTGGNLRLAFLILFVILCLLVLMFGLLVNDDRELGVVEYCACQIVMALSVHYLLYIGHAYIISPFQTRFGRTRHGLLEWGASIFSAGVAMTLSSFVLIFATIQVLSAMGEILTQMSIIICLFTLTFYIPLLQCVGPMGSDARQAEERKKKLAEDKIAREAEQLSQLPGSSSAARPSAIQDLVGKHERTTSSPDFVKPDAASLTPPNASKAKIQRALERERRTAANRAAASASKSPHGSTPLRGGGGFTRAPDAPAAPSPPATVIEETPTNLLSSLDLPSTRVIAPPAKHTRNSASTKVPNPHSRIGLGSMTELTSMSPIDRRRNPEAGEMQLSSEEEEEETMDSKRHTRPRARAARHVPSTASTAARTAARTDAQSSGEVHTESEAARLTPMRDWAPVSAEPRVKRASGGLPPVALTSNAGAAAASMLSPSRALPPLDNSKLFSDPAHANLVDRPRQQRDGFAQGNAGSSAAPLEFNPTSSPSDSPTPDFGQSSPADSDAAAGPRSDHSWDASASPPPTSKPSSGKKKKPRAQQPRSEEMMLASDAAAAAAAAQSDATMPPSSPAVVLHTAPAASPILRPPSTLSSRPAVPSTLPPPSAPVVAAAPLSPSSPVDVASHDWDRDDAAVPSRMSLTKPPLGKAALPPVALSRPGSLSPAVPMPPLSVSVPLRALGSSKLPLPKLHAKPASSSPAALLAPASSLSPVASPTAAASASSAASPLSRPLLRLPSRAPPPEDDDLDLDIDPDDQPAANTNKATAGARTDAGAHRTGAGVSAEVEIDHGSWDD